MYSVQLIFMSTVTYSSLISTFTSSGSTDVLCFPAAPRAAAVLDMDCLLSGVGLSR